MLTSCEVASEHMGWAEMTWRFVAWQETNQLGLVALAVGAAFFLHNLIRRPYLNPLHPVTSPRATAKPVPKHAVPRALCNLV